MGTVPWKFLHGLAPLTTSLLVTLLQAQASRVSPKVESKTRQTPARGVSPPGSLGASPQVSGPWPAILAPQVDTQARARATGFWCQDAADSSSLILGGWLSYGPCS